MVQSPSQPKLAIGAWRREFTLRAQIDRFNRFDECQLGSITETDMACPERMYGVVLRGHGGPEMLEWRDDLAVPLAGKHDVVVRVSAAAVNNTDINTRTAWYSKGDAEADDAT